jgi:hypothetical protein
MISNFALSKGPSEFTIEVYRLPRAARHVYRRKKPKKSTPWELAKVVPPISKAEEKESHDVFRCYACGALQGKALAQPPPQPQEDLFVPINDNANDEFLQALAAGWWPPAEELTVGETWGEVDWDDWLEEMRSLPLS